MEGEISHWPRPDRPARCRTWVKRVILTVRKSLPVFPDKRTISGPIGMSQMCQEATFVADLFGEIGSLLFLLEDQSGAMTFTLTKRSRIT